MSFLGALFVGIYYILMIVLVTYAAGSRKIGKLRVFVISLFLTPLAGYVAYRMSAPAELLQYTRYRCPKCGLDFTEPMIDCPYCRRDGEVSKLHPMMMQSV